MLLYVNISERNEKGEVKLLDLFCQIIWQISQNWLEKTFYSKVYLLGFVLIKSSFRRVIRISIILFKQNSVINRTVSIKSVLYNICKLLLNKQAFELCVVFQIIFVYFPRIFDSRSRRAGNSYWNFSNVREIAIAVATLSLLIQKIMRGKISASRCFHSSLKIRANIIFSMVRETRTSRLSRPVYTYTQKGVENGEMGVESERDSFTCYARDIIKLFSASRCPLLTSLIRCCYG